MVVSQSNPLKYMVSPKPQLLQGDTELQPRDSVKLQYALMRRPRYGPFKAPERMMRVSF